MQTQAFASCSETLYASLHACTRRDVYHDHPGVVYACMLSSQTPPACNEIPVGKLPGKQVSPSVAAGGEGLGIGSTSFQKVERSRWNTKARADLYLLS